MVVRRLYVAVRRLYAVVRRLYMEIRRLYVSVRRDMCGRKLLGERESVEVHTFAEHSPNTVLWGLKKGTE